MAIIELTAKERTKAMHDPLFRVAVAKKSFFHFMLFYMSDSFELPPADFHKEMVESLESDDIYIAILGFRGSAKSTIIEAYALWAMLTGKNNFIVYIGLTMDDSKKAVANIRSVVEQNKLLQADFGIQLESKTKGFSEKWSETQLQVRNCTIVAESVGSKVRGNKFQKARIDMIIGDDLENVISAETKEKRKKTRSWFFTEVLPATKQGVLATDVKVVMIGNLVHRDCLLKYMQKSKVCRVHEFPLFDADGNITWLGLYPTFEAVEAERQKVMIAGEGMGSIIWAREYLLIEADEEDMILTGGEILRYPDHWLQRPAIRGGVGNDLAISKKQTADYTTFVKAKEVLNDEGEPVLLIMKNNVCERLNFSETINKAEEVDNIMPMATKFYSEKVAYQESAQEMMEKRGIIVERMTPTSDKRSRAITACHHIKIGRVMFPNEGAEDLIENIVGYGVEAHDDYTDAFSMVVIGMVSKKKGVLFA
jgi:predicted phage terminase large subunit-like protein